MRNSFNKVLLNVCVSFTFPYQFRFCWGYENSGRVVLPVVKTSPVRYTLA